jgi:hypothetical protein
MIGVTARTGSPLRPLFGARALAEWIRGGGKPDRAPLAFALRLRWHAALFELNWRMQLERIPKGELPPDPVFILGLWRSGTTVLHELLNACGGWKAPQSWQCFNPATCFMTEAPSRAAVVDRPMDRGRISTHGAQEDEFAILLLGEPTIYRGLLDPRRLPEIAAAHWCDREQDLMRWQQFLRGVGASGPGRLLLKSPGHSFRLPLIRRLFPRAKFIWIGRHPGEVLESNRRMWRAMMELYALWEWQAQTLERFLRSAVRAASSVLEQCLAELTAEQMLWVDFEALQTDPARVLRQILHFTGARSLRGDGASGVDIAAALASVPIYPGERAAMPDEDAVRSLERVMQAARRRFASTGTAVAAARP